MQLSGTGILKENNDEPHLEHQMIYLEVYLLHLFCHKTIQDTAPHLLPHYLANLQLNMSYTALEPYPQPSQSSKVKFYILWYE